ncbi:MAG: hypothetical protein HRT58_02610 [Crocinitomicaceae bacterium]|nr:hypothetical protein [Flavobacteriales bacterium]NQZ34521.1 hypothetical protein [Crocinitomicaceae bacterium]
MKHITLASIEKAIQKVDNLDEDGLERIAENYAVSQQVLLGYIMSAAVEYDNQQLEGLIIYYYCLICEAFTQQDVLINEIVEDDIDAFEEGYFAMLDEYFKSEDEETINDFCDQPELTRFMMIEVSTDDEDGSSLDDDTATQLFIVTLAMIALMNRAIKA